MLSAHIVACIDAWEGDSAFAVEPLFFEHGVDLMLCGHVHDYARYWPTCPSPCV